VRKPPPSGDRWLRAGHRSHRLWHRSHPLPSGGQRREKTTTVWRQVATALGIVAIGSGILAIRCQAVDSGVRKPPPSGDRWLRAGNRSHRLWNRSHPLPSGGQRREKTSTVWRQVATGEVLSYGSSQSRSDDTPLPCLRHPRPPWPP
jgi:hypothetical protein